MSTRGLYGFIECGEYIATYNQSDSYPSGLGLEFLTACKSGDFSGYPVDKDINKIGFIKDSLYCEWAYFFNRDTNEFEIWKGYQKEPDPNNKFGQNGYVPYPGCKYAYYPCKKIFGGNINEIPVEILKDDKLLILMIERGKKLNEILGYEN